MHPRYILSDAEVAARIREICASFRTRPYEYHEYNDVVAKRRAVRGLLSYHAHAGEKAFAEAVAVYAALQMPRRIEDVLNLAREKRVPITPFMQRKFIVGLARAKEIAKAEALLKRYLENHPADMEMASLLLWLRVHRRRRRGRAVPTPEGAEDGHRNEGRAEGDGHAVAHSNAHGSSSSGDGPDATARYLHLASLLGVEISKFALADCVADAAGAAAVLPSPCFSSLSTLPQPREPPSPASVVGRGLPAASGFDGPPPEPPSPAAPPPLPSDEIAAWVAQVGGSDASGATHAHCELKASLIRRDCITALAQLERVAAAAAAAVSEGAPHDDNANAPTLPAAHLVATRTVVQAAAAHTPAVFTAAVARTAEIVYGSGGAADAAHADMEADAVVGADTLTSGGGGGDAGKPRDAGGGGSNDDDDADADADADHVGIRRRAASDGSSSRTTPPLADDLHAFRASIGYADGEGDADGNAAAAPAPLPHLPGARGSTIDECWDVLFGPAAPVVFRLLAERAVPPMTVLYSFALQGLVAPAASLYAVWARGRAATLAMVEGMIQVHGSIGDFNAAYAVFRARPFTKITGQMLWKLMEAAVIACLCQASTAAATARVYRLIAQRKLKGPVLTAAIARRALTAPRAGGCETAWNMIAFLYDGSLAQLAGNTARTYALAVYREYKATGNEDVAAQLEALFWRFIRDVETTALAVALSEPLVTLLFYMEESVRGAAVLRAAVDAVDASTVQYVLPHFPALSVVQGGGGRGAPVRGGRRATTAFTASTVALTRADVIAALHDLALAADAPAVDVMAPLLSSHEVWRAHLAACLRTGSGATARAAVAEAVARGVDVLADVESVGPLLVAACAM